jgi:chemotaxis methyl-accepting protein methylase/nitrogen-specific signal transduction histidine kinase/CheY-like chemotaxis protein
MYSDIFEIIKYISSVSNIDFSQYKETTLRRRINKCCSEKNFSSYDCYLNFLKEDVNETFYLIQQLLIGVTSFFRDYSMWKYLYSNIIPKLIEDNINRPIRIWIPGCSTGQEAYSMAILISSYLEKISNNHQNIKIFATDLSQEKINIGSKGSYSLRQIAGLTDADLKKYFIKYDDNYVIKNHLRKMITFAPHNILNQPYFKNINLISCRNLLIYIKPKYQHTILCNYYNSLVNDGYLLLGNGDTIGFTTNFFKPIHSKNKLYQKITYKNKKTIPKLNWSIKPNIPLNNIIPNLNSLIEKGESNMDLTTCSDFNIDFEKLSDYGKQTVHKLIDKLKKSNEELQQTIEIYNSTSEEYQATNEELITTNEELESTNQELLSSYSHLEEANLELHNIFKSTNLGILFLNANLEIKKFTPGVTTYYNIWYEDINRSIKNFTTNFSDSYRQEIIKSALKIVSGEDLIELEYNIDDNKHILVRLSPYYKNNSEKDGVVINFIDITAIKNIKLALETEKKKLEYGYKIGRIASWEWSFEKEAIIPDSNWFTTFGISRDLFKYDTKYYISLIHPKDIHIVMDIISKYKSGIVDNTYSEYRIFSNKLNEYIWLESIGKIVDRHASGKPKKIIGIHHDITSIKKTEQRLFIKNYALNNSIIQILSCNKNGEVTYLNSYAKESFYNSNKKISNLYYWDIIESSSEILWKEKWNNIKDKKHTFYETTIHNKYNTPTYVIVNENYINYEDEELLFLFVMNITKSVIIKQDLEKSIHRYELAEQMAKVGYLEFELTSKEIILSKGFRDIFYISSKNLRCGDLVSKIHPEDKSMINKIRNTVINKSHCKERLRLIHKNNIYYIDIQAKIAINNSSKIIVMAKDVTQNVISHKELLSSQQKFKSLFDNMPSPCSISKLLYDKNNNPYDYIIVDINSAFENMVNSNKADYVGTLGSNQPYYIGERWMNIYKHVVKTGESTTFDTCFTEQLKHFTVNVFKHSDDYFVSIYSDITNRKLYEKEVVHTEKMAAIGQLAGGVAHDFNNQLMGMQGALNLMELNNAYIAQSKYLHMIQNSIDNCTGLVKQLLAFSKKGDYIVIEINAHDALKKTIQIIEHTIDKKIYIHFDLNAEEHYILGDMSLLESAFLNLMINARDAMPHGGELYIKTYNTLLLSNNTSNHIAIEIKDSGIGMDDNTIKHIFEPFFTTKGMDKGTGMGLAAVYGTVQKMTGQIKVESTPGIGTTFTIYIPTILSSSKKEKTSLTTNTPDKCTILLVDDEPVVRNVLVELLAKHSMVVIDFEDGYEAIDFYKNNYSKIDLVMLDMIMPNLNGIEVLQNLKFINPHLKALLISGFSEDLDHNKIIDLGFIGKISKPFNIASILTEITKIQNL